MQTKSVYSREKMFVSAAHKSICRLWLMRIIALMRDCRVHQWTGCV